MFLLCKHVRLTCGFNKLMMMMMRCEDKRRKTLWSAINEEHRAVVLSDDSVERFVYFWHQVILDKGL